MPFFLIALLIFSAGGTSLSAFAIAIDDDGVHKTIAATGGNDSNTIKPKLPQWIKHNAEWYSQGLISEDEFTQGIEWMANNNVIHISPAALTNTGNVGSGQPGEMIPCTDGLGHSGFLHTNSAGVSFCFVQLPYDVCHLSLMVVEDPPLCLTPKGPTMIHDIENPYYQTVSDAAAIVVQELTEQEQNSTFNMINCNYAPPCNTPPNFPSPDLQSSTLSSGTGSITQILQQFEQTVEQADQKRQSDLQQYFQSLQSTNASSIQTLEEAKGAKAPDLEQAKSVNSTNNTSSK